MKPEWKDAPGWAKWLAQDFSGEWWWYREKPYIDKDIWSWPNQKYYFAMRAGTDKFNRKWYDTLEEKP